MFVFEHSNLWVTPLGKNLGKVAIFFLALGTCSGLVACHPQPSKKHMAQQIIVEIEAYRDGTGQLPPDLEAIGKISSEAGPIYYDPNFENQTYVVSYGLSLGESAYYRSESRKWMNR